MPAFYKSKVGFLAIWECLPYEVLRSKELEQAIEAVMGKQVF
ncbi:hypothetical protein [Helicobacter ailurogastricus]|nr:hypothetical protein [Helicobacter ailurogastricus]